MPEENILTKSGNLEVYVKYLTKGTGAQVIINTETGELFQAAKNCLAFYGRMVHVGKTSRDKYNTTGMNCFGRCCAIYGVDPETIFQKSINIKHRIHRMIQQGIDAGVVIPLERTIFGSSSDEDVFK